MSLSFWNPNSVFAGFDDYFFADPTLATSNPSLHLLGVPPALTRFKTAANANELLRYTSPRYEVTENDKRFRLALDVPGVKSADMKIELEQDGRVIHVTGKRKVKTDNSFEEQKFEKRFTLGRDLDISKITAHLNDGVLVLTAPKKVKTAPVKQEIAITLGAAPALMDWSRVSIDEENN